MYKFQSPYSVEHVAALPENCRPVVRFRREAFGYLAAFPDGRLAMYQESAGSLLASGSTFEQCKPFLLTHLQISTDFHFSAPLMGWLEITRRCNLRCPHCFVEGGVARSTELSTERILRLLDEWAEMGVFSVVITGGEPAIHRDFLKIVNYAYELGFVVGIATNGMPLTESVLGQIPRDDIIISISIDGIHGQGKSRGETDFHYVTRRLLQIQEKGFNASIMTTTTQENVGDLQTIINWAIDNDISLRSVPFVPMGRGALNKQLLNSVADVELAAQFWIAEEKWERVRDKKLGLCAGKVYNFLLTMVFATQRCMSGRGLCYVTSAGDVYPCTLCSGGKVLCGGNIQFSSFAEIWENGDWPIRQITWKDFRETCEGCPISDEKYFCTGRCPGSSSILNGTLNSCGTTDFQLQSIVRREAIFREQIHLEPRIRVTVPSSSENNRELVSDTDVLIQDN